MEPFHVRLNCIDHYQATPSKLDPPLPFRDGNFDDNAWPKVPVIRVFGATETGQRVCVHVHGAFPYLYIEYSGSVVPEAVSSAIRTLHISIDHALAASFRRNAYDRKTAYVAHITLVKGIPFYGYHVGYRTFFKIYLLNPFYVTRLTDLLHEGAVLNRPLQPYESHLQYVPQWMCDYNLYGCGYMECGKVTFRRPVPEYLELNHPDHRWHDRSISIDSILEDPALAKQSYCPLEADVCVHDILNRRNITERALHHDFTEFLRPAAFNERLVPSLAGLWQDETRRRKKRLGITDPGSTPFSPDELVSMSADPRMQSKGGWVHEDEFRKLALQIAVDEKKNRDGEAVSFETFVDGQDMQGIKTALSSVEDFYPDRFDSSVRHDDHRLQHAPDEEPPHVSANERLAPPSPTDEQYASDLNGWTDISTEYQVEEEPQQPQSPANRVIEESFYDGVFDEYPPAGEAEDPRPVNATFVPGFNEVSRKAPSFLSTGLQPSNGRLDDERENAQNLAKRSHPEILDSDQSRPAKQPRIPRKAESPHAQKELNETAPHPEQVRRSTSGRYDASAPSSALKPAAPWETVRPRAASQMSNGGLNFPAVEDPTDPFNILRFGQEDTSASKEDLQSSQPVPNSFPSGSSTSSILRDASGAFPSMPYSSLTVVERRVALHPHVAGVMSKLRYSFHFQPSTTLCLFQPASPSTKEVETTMETYGRPATVYPSAYYGKATDVPARPHQYAGREVRLKSDTIHFLPDFNSSANAPASNGDQASSIQFNQEQQEKIDQQLRVSCTSKEWEFAPVPPTRAEVVDWFDKLEASRRSRTSSTTTKQRLSERIPEALSQIEGPTQKNRYGFKYSQKAKTTSVEHQTQDMSTMSLEVHVKTRGTLSANPDEDEISCIFWCIQSDDEDIEVNSPLPGVHVGMIYQGDNKGPKANISKALGIDVEHEPTELELINRLIDIVRYHDPDIITAYEVHHMSWGYVIERARKIYDFDLCDELARVRSPSHGSLGKEPDRWGLQHASSIRVTGRHTINIWRAMRGELNLQQYTMENVAFHLLQRRIPHYSAKDLTQWYQSEKPRSMLTVAEYFTSRVQMNLEILDANELIPRTSEQARLLGIDFYSVFARGSQFKVESLMFRIAKPENFLLVSPSRKQVGQQNALECLPLVMEPRSDFYTSPVVVLDFQSLYPSVMIAYNYCYSTFLGRAVRWRGRDKMGFLDYRRPPRLLELLEDGVNIAPNGMMYAKREVRQSLLAKMLTEILETRVMVKGGMKVDPNDKTLQRLLHNRQLALKLIANVTYGYTSASFSGRMPCSEIADSIVQSGRETLEKAIALIHSVERWGAEVVYGDTDSLFVHLPGRTRDQAFEIGDEIAQMVTKMNPRPIKLKFEKVYHPCVLLAKKRYVGFKYEHRRQTEPEFDAKGMETVRRDGTPAQQKIEEKAVKLLFRTADLSQVKSYVQRQCSKILQGRVSIQDFCFAREVRLGTYHPQRTLPAGAMISTKRMVADPRQEPQYGERVPYVVVTGAPGSRLIDRCVGPETLLHDAQLELDAEYYITKNILPPLERIFNLVGANVRQWYDEMPKVQRIRRVGASSSRPSREPRPLKKTLESYLPSSSCIICGAKRMDAAIALCSECQQHPHISLFDVCSRLQRAEKRVVDLEAVCRSCMGVPAGEQIRCDSMDCPVFYSRTRESANWRRLKADFEPVAALLEKKSDEGMD